MVVSKEEMQDALIKFVDRILVQFNVGKGYKVKTDKDILEGNFPVPKGGRPSKKNPTLHHHSTVTDWC